MSDNTPIAPGRPDRKPRGYPYVSPSDADTHALCGIGSFNQRWRFPAQRCRARSRAVQQAARLAHWREAIAYARAHFQAARRLGFEGSFLACAHRHGAKTDHNPTT